MTASFSTQYTNTISEDMGIIASGNGLSLTHLHQAISQKAFVSSIRPHAMIFCYDEYVGDGDDNNDDDDDDYDHRLTVWFCE